MIGHEAYLAQSIANILNNAVKFVPSGVRPTIHISAEVKGHQVRVNFKDNGIGIEPEHREQIFNLFGRVHPDKAYSGTGIGLAIVKKALERMGGTVGVESEPGRGSCFFIQLPLAK